MSSDSEGPLGAPPVRSRYDARQHDLLAAIVADRRIVITPAENSEDAFKIEVRKELPPGSLQNNGRPHGTAFKKSLKENLTTAFPGNITITGLHGPHMLVTTTSPEARRLFTDAISERRKAEGDELADSAGASGRGRVR